jgi:DNA helicase-2/ATP-dependent DNA helicase PcrA
MQKELSTSQQAAISKVEGPCIILAGAGTGKTHTIVEKIKYLIRQNIYNPEKIVCITFSNEAANNLLTRVRSQLDLPQEKEPIIRTFHALSSLILKNHGEKIGLSKDFEILDPDEAKILLHTNLKVPTVLCHRYVAAISTAKDIGITITQLQNHIKKNNPLEENLKEKLESIHLELHTTYQNLSREKKSELKQKAKSVKQLHDLEKFIKSWTAYEKLKDLKDLQDYSDLNNNALYLLKQHPEITSEIQYMIVDEFQDTNKIQLDMLFSLAKNKNITVVGDLNQSIYQFRGAYEENINQFKKYFQVSNKDIYNLDKSFRSPNKILSLAHQLILKNYTDPSLCFEVKNAHAKEGNPVQVLELNNAKEEARKIIEIIQLQVSQGTPLEEICILYRTHQQSRTIKKALETAEIPFIAIGKSSLLKQKSVKQTINYLTILKNLMKKNSSGLQEWWDLIYQTSFSREDLIKVTEFIKESRDSENYNAKILSGLDKLPISQEGKLLARSITDRIKLLIPHYEKPLPELLEQAYPIIGVFQETDDQKKESILNINKFHELAKKHSKQHYPELESFLHHLAIMSELNIEIEAAEIESRGVRLMTSHATKGLEFKTIILTNLAEKRFPLESRSQSSLIPLEIIQQQKNPSTELSIEEYEKYSQLLEERRLCYVSFTRAKENLFITYAKSYADRKSAPSPFLQEIKFKENPQISFVQDKEDKAQQEIENLTIKSAASEENQNSPTSVDITKKAFSPSSLLIFKECQKRFEYKYIYNMPEKATFSMDAAKVGSFIHLVLEKGVSNHFSSLKQFKDLALTLHSEEEWESVDLSEALLLIKIFFERNKNKFNPNSKTEQPLKLEIEGLKFIGFADRIDFPGDNEIEIIDYKTGKVPLSPLQRNFQLGYYALAASKLGKVKKLTLDMLRHEKPLEFEIDETGLASTESGRMSFNIHEVQAQLTETAKEILKAYQEGFKPCPVEKNCQFCEEYVY